MPRAYSLSSETSKQTDVRLVTKFGDWESGDRSIELRVPWMNGAVLSTSGDGTSGDWGTITGRVDYITGNFRPSVSL